MKRIPKIMIGVLLIFLTIIVLSIIWFDESRKFYCADNNCITVWKRIGGTCYIINSKYYGLFKPTNKSYLQTTTDENLTLVFYGKMPKQIIVIDREDSKTYGKHFTIHNNLEDSKEFISYTNEYEQLLFTTKDVIGDIKDRTIRPDSNLLTLDIKEGYAISKDGIIR